MNYLALPAFLLFWVGISLVGLRRPKFVVFAAPALMSILLKTTSVLYIDLCGPFYSRQLQMEVGLEVGSLHLLFSYALLMLGFFLVIEFCYSKAEKNNLIFSHRKVGKNFQIMNVIISMFLVFLCLNLARAGTIPLLDKIERYDFAVNHGGAIHGVLIKYLAIISSLLGVCIAYSYLVKKKLNVLAATNIFVILVYGLLTSHRFSYFNKVLVFSFVPMGVMMAGRMYLVYLYATITVIKKKILLSLLLLIILTTSVGSVVYSYAIIRTSGDATLLSKIDERVLIQQGELWFATMNMHENDNSLSLSKQFELLFTNPIDPARNTSIQLLTVNQVGLAETRRLGSIGQQYAGGFPEIFLSLSNYAILPLATLFTGVLLGFVTILFITSVTSGKVLCCVLGSFLLYGVYLTLFNGMLNQYFQITFCIKVILFLVLYNTPTMRLRL